MTRGERGDGTLDCNCNCAVDAFCEAVRVREITDHTLVWYDGAEAWARRQRCPPIPAAPAHPRAPPPAAPTSPALPSQAPFGKCWALKLLVEDSVEQAAGGSTPLWAKKKGAEINPLMRGRVSVDVERHAGLEEDVTREPILRDMRCLLGLAAIAVVLVLLLVGVLVVTMTMSSSPSGSTPVPVSGPGASEGSNPTVPPTVAPGDPNDDPNCLHPPCLG